MTINCSRLFSMVVGIGIKLQKNYGPITTPTNFNFNLFFAYKKIYYDSKIQMVGGVLSSLRQINKEQ